jgi:hypothetical protein
MGDSKRRRLISGNYLLRLVITKLSIKQFGMVDGIKESLVALTNKIPPFYQQLFDGEYVEVDGFDCGPMNTLVFKARQTDSFVGLDVNSDTSADEFTLLNVDNFSELLEQCLAIDRCFTLDCHVRNELVSALTNCDKNSEAYIVSFFPERWLPITIRNLELHGRFLFVQKFEYEMRNVYA